MSTDIRITPSATGKRLLIVTPYNADFVAEIKTMGGRWESGKRAWSVDQRDEDRARALLRSHFGTDGSPDDAAELVTVRIPLARYELSRRDGAKAQFAGRIIANRPGRDSPVRLGQDVVLAAGQLPHSGGSMRYPQIGAGPDVVVEVRDLPRPVLEQYDDDGYEIVKEEGPKPQPSETAQLRARRDELLSQVHELDDILHERDPEGEKRREEEAHQELVKTITARVERQHAQDKRAAIHELVLAQKAKDEEQATQERRGREEEERRRQELRHLPLTCRCGAHTCPPAGYTVTQYAEIRHVTSQTVTAWCKKGKIPAVQHNRRWYIITDER